MYLEEQFSSNFFEDRKIKQVPIARFTDQENDRIIAEISNEQYSNDYFEDLIEAVFITNTKINKRYG